ncbi:MAG: UDP-2,3-diacylglucosamine diphosphatase [Gammaproteobacteria bacterium]
MSQPGTEVAVHAHGHNFSASAHTVFLSDVHLDVSRPEVTTQLTDFLNNLSDTVERLYIVGDLFEAWIGDDAPGPVGEQLIEILRTLSERNIEGYFTHGNRDFLIGQTFAQQTGFSLLPDETVIDCYGTPVLLLHGDTLCTDDTDYQTLRATLRNPDFQANLMAMSVPQRLELAQQLRAASASEMSNKTEDIMDANQNTVIEALQRNNVSVMLHGHTHRPNVHTFSIDDTPCQRIVLGDWFEQGSVVYWSADGFELQSLNRQT